MSKFLVALMICTSAAPAFAGTVLETNRANIQAKVGADFIEWSTVGGDYFAPDNPFNATSAGGETVAVSKTLSGKFELRTQGTSWNGNFASGDALLWTTGGATANEIRFSGFGGADLYSAGTQIMADWYGDFVARINTYDSGNSLISTYTRSGTSSGGAGGSAIFIGVSGDVAFRSFGITLDSAATDVGDFAINRVDFATSPAAAVPLPSAAWLGLGLLGLLGLGRKLRISG